MDDYELDLFKWTFDTYKRVYLWRPAEGAELDRVAREFVPGARVRHKSGWTGVVTERPVDADPGVHESAIWIQPDGSIYGPSSWAPFALVDDFDIYHGPVDDRITRWIESRYPRH